MRNSDDSRGHLIGRQFGGDGHDMRNIITQGKVQNNGDISDVENSIAEHVRTTKNTVLMSVTPLYRNGGVRASHVLIEAGMTAAGQSPTCFPIFRICYGSCR
ncbi:DNA/RNA non-specific endonuclease [Streptomyces fagopyri]|uniref:DNA/RNA non-specific endonuclease n=1 Tax=Streptomyces fagopyri TaxID=2662397 RepID=UPI00371392C2